MNNKFNDDITFIKIKKKKKLNSDFCNNAEPDKKSKKKKRIISFKKNFI